MATVLRLRNGFGLDNLHLEQEELHAPGSGEVRVRFHAASLNYRDLMVALGTYNPKMELPRILGSDAAGEVVEVGENVTSFKPSDCVASLFFQNWRDGEIAKDTGRSALGGTIDGVFATERIMPETGLIHVPEYLSNEQAATLPCAALTAWNALIEKGKLRAGETVLLLGTGGVSLFALQIAKAHGAKVILTSSSDEKLERGKQLGADHTVNYKTHPHWDKQVKEITGGAGVDHMVEVGGGGTLPLSAASMRTAGNMYIIGVLSGVGGQGLDPRAVLSKSLNVYGIYVGSFAMFERMNAFFTANRIEPVIDRTFPFSEARTALEYMQSGSHFGKIVLSLDQ